MKEMKEMKDKKDKRKRDVDTKQADNDNDNDNGNDNNNNNVNIKIKKDKKQKRNDNEDEQLNDPTTNDTPLPPPRPTTTTTTTTTTIDLPITSTISSSILTDKKFSELPINSKIIQALNIMKFNNMSSIQLQSIPECLSGNDLVGAAKTGSGKTLAFLIPIIDILVKVQFTRKQGTGAIIISPTRELSLQIYGVLRDIMDNTGFPQTHGLVIGGANRRSEAEKLAKGVNILVATPGRLLDHLQNTQGFNYQRLQMLVIDEADRILEQGFEEDMHQIIKLLPKQRQTILFSATQTRKVEDLARLSMQGTPKYVGVHDDSAVATVDGLQQGYVLCPAEKRFLLLYTFLKKNKNKKVMVCYSTLYILTLYIYTHLYLCRIAAGFNL